MRRSVLAVVLAALACAAAHGSEPPTANRERSTANREPRTANRELPTANRERSTAYREPQTADRQPQTANRERPTPAEIAAASENPSTAAWRYRTAIAGLLQLKPGMVAAEIGPGSAYLARTMAAQVAPDGRVIAAALDPAMAAFVGERAKAEGIRNLSTLVVQPDGTGLQPASLDAVAIVNALGGLARQQEIVQAVAAALKPGGALVVVDVPAESVGSKVVGLDADDVVKLATAAGLKREAESTVVPGQYAIRFRKP